MQTFHLAKWSHKSGETSFHELWPVAKGTRKFTRNLHASCDRKAISMLQLNWVISRVPSHEIRSKNRLLRLEQITKLRLMRLNTT